MSKEMFGMSESDIREQYMESITAKLSGLEMAVAGILSDCQELITSGMAWKMQGSYGRTANALIDAGYCVES